MRESSPTSLNLLNFILGRVVLLINNTVFSTKVSTSAYRCIGRDLCVFTKDIFIDFSLNLAAEQILTQFGTEIFRKSTKATFALKTKNVGIQQTPTQIF